jgi:hypothetical protein
MKQKLRVLYLWLRRELKIATTKCAWCGARGATPCSVAKLTPLCEPCCTLVCCSGGTYVSPNVVRIK